MAKPFGNMAQLTGDILDSYIMGLQAGSTPDNAGLDEMKYVRVDKLRRYIREGLVTAYTPRENSSIATPSSPQVGDIFMCTGEFTESGITYQLNHFYVYTTQLAWEDITAGIKGPKGDTGVTPLLSVGEVTYGDTPNVTIDTTDPAHPVMNFVLKTSEVGVVDNLTSDSSVDALSAKQGKMLKQDTDILQSQIINTNAELDNVEALIGGDAQVENTDPTEGESLLAQSRLIHHANLLPNGSFGRVGARSMAWNQYVQTQYTNINVTCADLTNNVPVYYAGDICPIPNKKAPNKLRIKFSYAGYANISSLRIIVLEANNNNIVVYPINGEYDAIVSLTAGNTFNKVSIRGTAIDASDTTAYNLKFNVTDVTEMGEDGITIAQFKALFPASYYPYDAGSIYDLNPTGFRIRGINLWDEEWEVGSYSSSDGSKTSSSVQIRCKNKIVISPSQTYYFCYLGSNVVGKVLCYDINETLVSVVSVTKNTSFTTPSSACFMTFVIGDTGVAITTYNHDIQICYNSLPTALKTAYHAYDGHTVETPQIADGHYVNENCYDYVENVVEDGIVKGKKHTKVGVVDLGTLNWNTAQSYHGYYRMVSPDLRGIIKSAGNEGKSNILCPKYMIATPSSIYSETIGMGVDAGGSIVVYDPNYNTSSSASAFKASLAGVMLYYELATESITDCEPLRSFSISDYCTIEPITPQTELVNRIDVPFSVKSVSANTLIEQINQNTADIAEEKATRTAQVSALDKRVKNLELKTGDQFDVDYPSDTYGMDGVPSNVEPFAKVKGLKGIGRVANNLGKAINSTNWIPYSTTYSSTSFADGIVTMSWKADVPNGENFRYGIRQSLFYKIYANHLYLISYEIYTSKDLRYVDESLMGSYLGPTPAPICEANKWTKIAYVVSASANNDTRSSLIYPNYNQSFVEGDYFRVRNYILTDLSVYFNTLDLSWIGSTYAERIATIQTNYHELLIPSDYDAGSLVSTTYSAVKSVGRNLFNSADFEMGDLASDTGANVTSSTAGRSKNYIPVKPNTLYYFYDQTINPLKMRYYDINKNYIGFSDKTGGTNAQNQTRLMPDNCFYIRFAINGVTSIADNAICVNLSDSNDGTFTPYMTDTLTLPYPVTLKGAGDKAEEYYPETGRVTHPIGEHIITGNENMNYGTWADNTISLILPSARPLARGNSKGLTSIYENVIAVVSGGLTYIRFVGATSRWANLDDFKADAVGKTIYYELATPSPDTYVDPIPDPFIQVEGGGTIKPVQSQSPEVDSAMTVKYMAS